MMGNWLSFRSVESLFVFLFDGRINSRDMVCRAENVWKSYFGMKLVLHSLWRSPMTYLRARWLVLVSVTQKQPQGRARQQSGKSCSRQVIVLIEFGEIVEMPWLIFPLNALMIILILELEAKKWKFSWSPSSTSVVNDMVRGQLVGRKRRMNFN